MEGEAAALGDVVFEAGDLERLIGALAADGYEVLGPTVESGVVVHRPIEGTRDLPRGRRSDQAPGRARLVEDGRERWFAATPGADSWRQTFFPGRQVVLEATRDETGRLHFRTPPEPVPTVAVVGVRSCDLAALRVQDGVLGGGAAHPDADYVERRSSAVVVAVACTEPAATCFCASMGTGPAPGPGADLVLTEIHDGDGHRFLARADTARGRELLDLLPHRPADDASVTAATEGVDAAAGSMQRRLDPGALRGAVEVLARSGRFDLVAERCLACAGCTLVCPTCFCHSVVDTTDLAGSSAQRERVWASCFTDELSHLSGVGPVRAGIAARYRQWLLHKLSTWWDQFDTSGCVGCGRCITWCPVGIDLTEEATALAAEVDAVREWARASHGDRTP